MAKQFCRWDPETKIIDLRFSNVMEPHDYAGFPDFERDPHGRKWNLWSYIDARDAAQAIRRALEVPLKGAEVFIIANSAGVDRGRETASETRGRRDMEYVRRVMNAGVVGAAVSAAQRPGRRLTQPPLQPTRTSERRPCMPGSSPRLCVWQIRMG